MDNFIWPCNFSSTLITENTIFPNFYNLSVCIEPIQAKSNINLGFRKIKYFVDNCLHNGIFISQTNELKKIIENTENSKIIFPSEPYDFTVGTVLLYKFSIITNKYFNIEYLSISSTIGENIQYTVLDTSELNHNEDNWWNKDSPSTELNNRISWEDLNLKDTNQFSPTVIKGGLEK